ncbi:unnamed protein product [Rotaria socialis]|uniref:non-specific serine/threonine protein kinase n=1 Tax=Rotaria socialis TaxID=392032 RepID=A0A819WDU8_9BILA|nr:unnamed protein product [Rotaria socialis]CAF3582552.1 unnamed protein product [Rotaria socialis]CAF4125139.1 unnamed protein product [Rotaria socialis]CAF4176696.1 unnamed protein product [Rotaria socialis]
MVFKATASLIARLSRAFVSRPFKPTFNHRIYQKPPLNKTHQVYSKHAPRLYLFPSINRSIFLTQNGQNMSNLMPFRMALNEIKRRLFFAAPSSSRLILGLLGYSFVQQGPINNFRFNETFNKIGDLLSKTTIVDQFNDENEKYNRASLDDYELGRLLGCGCNAAVYEARLRSPSTNSTMPLEKHTSEHDTEILSRQSSNSSSVYEDINQNDDNKEEQLNELTLKEVRYRVSTSMQQTSDINSDVLPAGQFNLAIKMLFNYGIQSNAEAIEKAMEKELLPLRKCFHHPNVVRMYSCFVDSFPLLNEAHASYPMAIPTRLDPGSCGQNKTLFIVMRRYDLTFNQYIQLNQPNTHERLLLFAQLLEALLYLNNHSIAHRDLKSDNLLICNETGELVLADFGCALYHPPDLKISYQTDDICKGGNPALMAPEISTCQPGSKRFLDYSKSDLWASGTLCYEFFSQSNPFFHGTLRPDKYDDEKLPSLSSKAPIIIELLAHSMLRKNPEKRPSISLVSNCVHLCLWFKTLKSQTELYQAYMWTALETLFHKHTLTRVEINLKKLFFERQTCQSLYRAQAFLNQLQV